MALEILVFGVFPGLVVLAATMDLFTMTIPNRLCLALAGAFVIAAPIAGLSPETIGWHVLSGVIALVVTFALFATGVFGGGDAKLTAAIALWLGPALSLDFALLAAVLGGLLTLLFLIVRAMPAYTMVFQQGWTGRLLSPDVGIPYGIALSAAAMTVFAKSPWFTVAIGS